MEKIIMSKIKYVLALSFVAIATSYGMDVDQPVKPAVKGRMASAHANEYVDVDIAKIAHYTGSVNNLRFYNEYRPKMLNDNTISFPLNACDPVPIHTFGDIRYFYTSAMAGKFPHPGSPYQIEKFTNIFAVRGKNDLNGARIEVYLGINENDFKEKGTNKIYTAQLLVLQKKSTKRVNESDNHTFDTKLLRPHQLSLEISKRLENRKDSGWGNPQFQKAFLELLGEGWVHYRVLIGGKIRPNVFTRDDEVIGNGVFHSSKVYWTKNENKLKGITYSKK